MNQYYSRTLSLGKRWGTIVDGLAHKSNPGSSWSLVDHHSPASAILHHDTSWIVNHRGLTDMAVGQGYLWLVELVTLIHMPRHHTNDRPSTSIDEPLKHRQGQVSEAVEFRSTIVNHRCASDLRCANKLQGGGSPAPWCYPVTRQCDPTVQNIHGTEVGSTEGQHDAIMAHPCAPWLWRTKLCRSLNAGVWRGKGISISPRMLIHLSSLALKNLNWGPPQKKNAIIRYYQDASTCFNYRRSSVQPLFLETGMFKHVLRLFKFPLFLSSSTSSVLSFSFLPLLLCQLHPTSLSSQIVLHAVFSTTVYISSLFRIFITIRIPIMPPASSCHVYGHHHPYLSLSHVAHWSSPIESPTCRMSTSTW